MYQEVRIVFYPATFLFLYFAYEYLYYSFGICSTHDLPGCIFSTRLPKNLRWQLQGEIWVQLVRTQTRVFDSFCTEFLNAAQEFYFGFLPGCYDDEAGLVPRSNSVILANLEAYL